jgi:hypothetical protein
VFTVRGTTRIQRAEFRPAELEVIASWHSSLHKNCQPAWDCLAYWFTIQNIWPVEERLYIAQTGMPFCQSISIILRELYIAGR